MGRGYLPDAGFGSAGRRCAAVAPGIVLVAAPAIADGQPQSTRRVSVTASGAEATGDSHRPVLSSTGRFVVFSSAAPLVARDTNGTLDVYLMDRATRAIRLISVSSTGALGNGQSVPGSVSADGRLVTFSSEASNLVPRDTNDWSDTFVRDRAAGQTRRLSVSSAGGQGTGGSGPGLLSRTGRYVAFESTARDLVRGDDLNGDRNDVFVRDRATHTTHRVGIRSHGGQVWYHTRLGGMSANGRFVAFYSRGRFVPGDTDGTWDVFARDRVKRRTSRVSVSTDGSQANGTSGGGSLSADGRFLVFESAASDLVPGDANGSWDVFIRDRVKKQTRRVSLSSTGAQGNGDSFADERAAISADGRYVVFSSEASNLVADDTNALSDVFVRDRWTQQTHRVNVSSSGVQADRIGDRSFGYAETISGDGRFIGFQSWATNVVPGDTNNSWDVFLRGPLS